MKAKFEIKVSLKGKGKGTILYASNDAEMCNILSSVRKINPYAYIAVNPIK